MEEGKFFKNSQIIILGLCIAVATIVSSIIISQGVYRVMRFTREVISVTGSAQKEIRSDYATWSGNFSIRGEDLVTCYNLLNDDREKVKAYLLSKGVNEQEMTFSQVRTMTFYQRTPQGYETSQVESYHLNQQVEIGSNDVDKITNISRESTELILQGVQFESWSPSYFYTKLDELRVEMLAQATENAKQRAENMAGAAGNRVGLMRSARMGVFQITPVSSTAISDYGMNDTSSLEKKITAVVSVTFAIE